MKFFKKNDIAYFTAYESSHHLTLNWLTDEQGRKDGLEIVSANAERLIEVLFLAHVFGSIAKVYPKDGKFYALINPR